MSLIKRISRRLLGELMPPMPFPMLEHLATYVYSQESEAFRPSPRLIQVTLDAVREQQHVDFSELAARPAMPPNIVTLWPGMHYQLLAGLVRMMQPRSIIEIGTFTGISALAMKQYLPADGQIATFDIMDWQALPHTCLTQNDFADGRLIQYVADLADPAAVAKHQDLLINADLIFMDGPHDGPTEYKMMENLASLTFRASPLFIFDDIKMPALMKFWRDLAMPKMDITSFGHWSGTGIAEGQPALKRD